LIPGKKDTLHSKGLTSEPEIVQAKSITIKGSVAHYDVIGSGEPLVLIHGLGGSRAWWGRNVGVLGQYFTVYNLDLPGFGAMRRHPTPFSVLDAVAWLQAFLDELRLERVSLVGHSMGGLISAIFAGERPGRLERLVLAAPAIELPSRRVAGYLRPLLRETLQVERSFWRILVWDGLRAGFPTTLRAARDLLGYVLQDELSRIASPSLLIWGERDPLIPPEIGSSLQQKIRDSQLCVLKGAGHVLMYDHPEQFNKAVVEFLTTRSGIAVQDG
jgi:pimeloyl-ACP methyl ester carboxylesterase